MRSAAGSSPSDNTNETSDEGSSDNETRHTSVSASVASQKGQRRDSNYSLSSSRSGKYSVGARSASAFSTGEPPLTYAGTPQNVGVPHTDLNESERRPTIYTITDRTSGITSTVEAGHPSSLTARDLQAQGIYAHKSLRETRDQNVKGGGRASSSRSNDALNNAKINAADRICRV